MRGWPVVGLARWLHSPSVQHQRRYWRQHDVNLASAWARRLAARREPAAEQAPGEVIVLPEAGESAPQGAEPSLPQP